MRWDEFSKRDIVLVAVLLALSACSRNGSNEPPPRSDTQVELESRPSTIVMPIVVPLADLQVELNKQVPNPLLAIDQSLDACIPAQWAIVCPVPKIKIKCRGIKCRKVAGGCAVRELKTKITPDISCRLKGSVTRGQLLLSGSGQTLAMSMPVKIDVSAKDVGGVIKSETATGSADVRASATVDIDEDWNPKADVTADYSWNNRIGVNIFGKRVTFASEVDPKLRDAIAKFRAGIPAQLEALAIKDKLSEAWAKGFSAIQLSENPAAWLRLTPGSVGYSGYEISDGVIRLSLMVEGTTETFIGIKPSDPQPTPLPKLVKNLPPEGFEFYLPVLASYSTLKEAAEKALGTGAEQTFDIPNVGNVKVTFKDVTIYQTKGGALAVGVQMTADTPNEVLDTEGTLWLSALPVIDNEKRVASVEKFQIVADTDNEAVNLLASVLRLPVINDRLRAAMQYDFSQKYTEALATANGALKRELTQNIFFDGQITNAAVDRVTATSEGLFLGLIVTGTARLQYAGPST